MESYKPRTRRERLILQELPDEVLIYDMERNEVHCLNGTAARVWSLCDGERTIREIGQIVAPDLEQVTADSLVWCAIDQFTERHLLEEVSEIEEEPSRSLDITRRQMVIRLGLIAGLSLPIVESIVSPPAAHAQSGSTGGTGATGM